jgi:hypothetical protein
LCLPLPLNPLKGTFVIVEKMNFLAFYLAVRFGLGMLERNIYISKKSK